MNDNLMNTISEITIRNARLDDAERLAEIFAYYVRNTAVAFDYDPPSVEEFRSRMEKIMADYPYLVAEKDGRAEGYACAKPFVGRAAYRYSSELTIYLDPKIQKCGIGRRLYEALEEELKSMGIKNLYACIADPEAEDEYLTKNSPEFHSHLGFVEVGRFHKCGRKFDRWYDMIWMEKIIGNHE